MSIRFTKMHGLGNDYVYVSLFDQQIADAPALARAVSDRHRGIGGDGLILVGPALGTDADVRMQMFNADGSRAQMCGNGVRCVAKLAYERGWAQRNPLRVQTDRGVLLLELTLREQRVERVRVDMGPPLLDPPQIPVLIDAPRVLDYPLEVDGRRLSMTCVSMGNPHAVFFVPQLDDVPLRIWGPLIERHELFPQRVNAHFVQVLEPHAVRMNTWERGSGATQACGTGASAVCVAGVLTGRTADRLSATLPGGELLLEWPQRDASVFMTGPATEVFTGVWNGDQRGAAPAT